MIFNIVQKHRFVFLDVKLQMALNEHLPQPGFNEGEALYFQDSLGRCRTIIPVKKILFISLFIFREVHSIKGAQNAKT